MRIVSWNCCLKLSKKFDDIKNLNPDILIIQECEELPKDFFPNVEYHWIGHNPNKGVGVLLFNNRAEVDASFNNKLDYFLPLNLDNGIKLLATWSFTHRAAGRFGEGHVGHVSDAIKYYEAWLNESDGGIICGDFNNSIIWDKSKKESNFKETNETLNGLGFRSAYHELTNEDFGKEKLNTLYHTKNKDKRYHIDYVFLKGLEPQSIEVGSYDDWISLSDHVPVTVST
jgi:exonuclease III